MPWETKNFTGLIYCDIRFIVMAWNQSWNTSEVNLYWKDNSSSSRSLELIIL